MKLKEFHQTYRRKISSHFKDAIIVSAWQGTQIYKIQQDGSPDWVHADGILKQGTSSCLFLYYSSLKLLLKVAQVRVKNWEILKKQCGHSYPLCGEAQCSVSGFCAIPSNYMIQCPRTVPTCLKEKYEKKAVETNGLFKHHHSLFVTAKMTKLQQSLYNKKKKLYLRVFVPPHTFLKLPPIYWRVRMTGE